MSSDFRRFCVPDPFTKIRFLTLWGTIVCVHYVVCVHCRLCTLFFNEMYTNDIVYTNDIIGLYTNDKVYTNDITLISLIKSLKLPRNDDQYAELLQQGAKRSDTFCRVIFDDCPDFCPLSLNGRIGTSKLRLLALFEESSSAQILRKSSLVKLGSKLGSKFGENRNTGFQIVCKYFEHFCVF